MKNGKQKGRIKKFLALIPFSVMESMISDFSGLQTSANPKTDFLKVLEFTDPSNSLQKFLCYFFLPKETYSYESKVFSKGFCCTDVFLRGFLLGADSPGPKVTEKPVCVQSPAPRVDVDMAQHKT